MFGLIKAVLAGAVALGLHAYASAQVPILLNYQGRVTVGVSPNAAPFDGNGQFKFALVDSAGTVTYWSNDGTSSGGGQPGAAVQLSVVKGLYSVLLGDTTLPNMTGIPASVFANTDIRVRVWFNDGTHGTQQLSPDQRVSAVGYAVSASMAQTAALAQSVSPGAIGSAQIGAGAVGSTQLANAAVTPAKNSPDVAFFYEASNKTGGNPLSGAGWHVRDLNTTQPNLAVGPSISRSGNTIGLLPGIYCIEAEAEAYNVGSHQLVLRDVTQTSAGDPTPQTSVLVGTSTFQPSSSGTTTLSHLKGVLTVSTPGQFQLWHYLNANASPSNALGVDTYQYTAIESRWSQILITRIQ